MHALIVSLGEEKWTPEGHQVHGFAMYERALRGQLGMSFEIVTAGSLPEIEGAVAGHPADVVFVMVSWREDPAEVTGLFRRLFRRADRPGLVFLDYFAPASSPFFGVLPYVDCYFKRQAYRDPLLYFKEFEGGTLLTDYVAKVLGIGLDGWDFSSTPDPRHLHKLVHGWNLGVTPHYRRLLKLTATMPLPWRHRPYAINCRLRSPYVPDPVAEWYHRHRSRWVEALGPLREEFRCTGAGRVRLRRYFAEMILSRIGVSPFGWGEVCFRDYEIVASGALLIKPSMAHLKTSPDIFVEGKTYVATSWDPDDIGDVCRHYLAHPEQAREIIHNARAALSAYFEHDGFVDDLRRVLEVASRARSDIPARDLRIPSVA